MPMEEENSVNRTITLYVSCKLTIAQQWCHNKFALRIILICAILSRAEIILWMKEVLWFDTRWMYLSRRKEIRLIQGIRFLSILFNLVNIWGVVQHKG